MIRETIIREIVLTDAEGLTAQHAASFGDDKWSLPAIEGSLILPTTKGWVAQVDGKPTGFILCQIVAGDTEILTLCVDPGYRRRGIAETLLRHLMDAAQKEKGAKIYLEVAADNEAARKLYEKLNFKITGTRKGYYKRGAVTVDGVMYQL